ncbi:MAG: transposase, partial [Chloroflexi bacterium]|nr:transposase [Chloroflexota bacterium]
VPFKVNSQPGASELRDKLYATFMFNRAAWLPLYHKRSNVETAFSMIKAKFGDALRCKTDEGLTNEMLLKVLCHNICVLIQEMQKLGIDPTFATENRPVAKVLMLSRKYPHKCTYSTKPIHTIPLSS